MTNRSSATNFAMHIAALATCLLFLSACSPRHQVIQPNAGVQMDPSIEYGVLDNGFQYIIKKNSIPEQRVYVHLDVFAGSLQEKEDQQGVAHYLEHLLFNGSEHFKPGELIDYFHSIGMDFGADANAHTSFFNTVYDLALPNSDAKQLDEAFLIIQDYAKGALLLEAEVERERGIILAEKRERDSVSSRVFKKTLAFELPGSLIAQRFPIGKESVLKKASRKTLKSYYDQWYRPDNMVLVVVGDLDVKQAEQMIIKRFSKLNLKNTFLPSKQEIDNLVKWEPHQGNKAFYYHEPEAATTDIAIQTITFTNVEPQNASTLKQQALLQVANSIVQNRISRMINSQKVAFTEASVYSGTFLHYLNASGIAATCQPDHWEVTLEQIEQILRQALEYGFTLKELNRIKSNYVASLEQAVELSKSQKSSSLAKRILSLINNQKLLISEEDRLKILKPFIDSISIEQAHSAFIHAWNKEHRLVTVTGNLKITSKNPSQKILQVFSNSNGQQLAAYQGFVSKSFPYLPIPMKKGGVPLKKDDAKDLGIEIFEFENNVRLNLKQTDFKPNEFLVKVVFGQGKRSIPINKPGLSILADDVLNDSGFGSMDTDQLEEALSGKKIRTSFGIQNNYFAISGSGNPEQAETLFQLIQHYFQDPGFSKKALELAKIRYRQDYDSLMRTADGLMKIDGEHFLGGNDSRFGLPLPDLIESYSIKDIKDWLIPSFNVSPIEVSIVGDFDTQKMIELTSLYLGTFKKRKVFPSTPIDTGKIFFPNGENLTLKVDTKIDTATVHISFLTDDFWDIMQTRRLSVLSRIFSERLRKVIREELGESYSPYVYNNASTLFKDYGVMHAVVNVKPGNHELVIQKIKDIVNSMHLNGISELETQYALNPIKTYLKTLRHTNGYWLNSVMSNSSNLPDKFDWARNILEGYNSITSEDLNLLVKKYLRTSDQATIVITPVEP